MASGTGLDKFFKEYPNQFFDVGIAEQHLVGMASGISSLFWKPVCAIYSTFLQRAYDQIFQEVALNLKHVIFMIDRSGIVGEDGPSHAGIYDISYLRVFPNFILMAPRNSYELKQMLFYALYKVNQPVAIRYPKDNCDNPFNEENFEAIELGKYQILQEGKDLTLFAYGSMVNIAMKVAEELFRQGLYAKVINARFSKPLNKEGINYLVSENKPIFILEEHNPNGGIYAAFLEIISPNSRIYTPIYSISVKDVWVKHGSRKEVLKSCFLDPNSIFEYVLKKCK